MKEILLRRARICGAGEGDGDRVKVALLEGPRRGEEFEAVFYSSFGGEMRVGREVVVNTVGVEMGLGTGGVVFVMPDSSAHDAPENQNHFVKLPYTPLQFPARLPEPEERGGGRESSLPLCGVPVVVLPLHSHLAPACAAAARSMAGCKVSFVWQEGGALAVEFSKSVEELKVSGLLDRVVASGSCFGGDDEAPNIYSALEAAGGGSDLVLVGIGPGVVGTATGYGHGGMSSAVALNAASSLGASPVFAPRISFADERERHRGISHHTRGALLATLARCRVALPSSALSYSGEEDVTPAGVGLHEYVAVEAGAGGLEEEFGLVFYSMGRGYEDDAVFFDAAAAAVHLALSTGEREGSK